MHTKVNYNLNKEHIFRNGIQSKIRYEKNDFSPQKKRNYSIVELKSYQSGSIIRWNSDIANIGIQKDSIRFKKVGFGN